MQVKSLLSIESLHASWIAVYLFYKSLLPDYQTELLIHYSGRSVAFSRMSFPYGTAIPSVWFSLTFLTIAWLQNRPQCLVPRFDCGHWPRQGPI